MEATCLRCNKTWTSKVEYPKQCTYCKSPYWDKPRKRNLKKLEQAVDLEPVLAEEVVIPVA